jgi:hypothetical protein
MPSAVDACETYPDPSAGRLAGLVSLRLLHAIRSVTKTAWLVLPGTNVATLSRVGILPEAAEGPKWDD